MIKRREIPKKLFLFFVVAGLMLSGIFAFAVEGGSAVGEKCKDCHTDLAKAFVTNVHARAGAYGVMNSGCESCHGPAASHIASGDKAAIVHPGKIAVEAATSACLKCHDKGKGQMFWHGSVHESQKVGCVSCHKVHGGNDRLLAKKKESDLCFACHADVRADMLKRSKHPLRDSSSPSGEGKMACSSCHNAHGAKGEKLISAKSFNDKCFECHVEKKAPLLWEHSPVKEDCLTCHNPHGSSNDKMLVTKVPRLCQQCHMQGRHQTGTLATNSVYAFNRGCVKCHPMVHGSNHPSGAVLQR